MDISLISRKLARLGWADATVAEAKDLSLGSQSLQEQVLHVLAKPHTIPAGFLNADPDVQFLYALRAGERPLTLRGWKYGNDPHILAEVFAGRGAKFVGKYLKYLGFYEDTAFSLTSTNMREIAIILVYSNPTLNFPIPQVPGYLSLWVKVAAHVLAGVERIEAPKNLPLPTREELIDRIDDHVAAALEAGLELWGPLGYLLVFLTRNRRFDRAQLISGVCESFAVAKWKQERQVLVEFLNEDLAVTDLELASNCAAFIPLFEAGDQFIMRTFGGRIIPLLDNSELVSAATTMLHTANTKCQRQILHGLAHREAPPKLESLEDVVVGLTQSSDAKVAKAACDLVQTWGIQSI